MRKFENESVMTNKNLYHRFLACFLTLVLCFTLLAGCNKSDEKLTKIRVNEVTHSIFYAPHYLAMELGFFEDEGIEIELTNGGGSNVSMTAVVSGQAEVGLLGPETAVYVYNQGKEDYPIVFGQLTACDGSFLVGKNAEPNFDYSSLEGKEILAGRKGGLPAMSLEYVLNKNGLYNGTNITLNYDVAFPLMAGAFDAGTGDYTTLFEPTASDFVRRGKGHIVSSIGEDGGDVPFTCYVATRSFIEENPKIIEGYLRAVYKAIEFMENNPSTEVAKALSPQFEGTTIEQIADSVDSYLSISAWKTDLSMTEDSFKRLQEIMLNANELNGIADYDILIDNTISNKVKKEFE